VTAPAPEVARLLALPRAERREALAELLVAEFRAVLRFPDDQEFPRRTGFFDLGMTSLRLTEVRQRLVRLLGTRLRVETMFEHATVDSLLDHLVDAVLEAGTRAEPEPVDRPQQLDALLDQLYSPD
jgi:hypothetical protein